MATARATTAAALAFGVLAVAGCGGDGDDGGGSKSTPSLANRPIVKQPIVAEVDPFNRALAAKSCRAFQPLVFSLVRGKPPGAPATAAECRQRDTAFDGLLGDQFTRAGQFGTGAVMEGSGAKNVRYTIWVLDGDGRFRFANVLGTSPPQLGAPFTDRPEANRVATRFLTAVRERDCPTMERLFSRRASRLVAGEGSARAACRAVLKGQFLAPAVRKTPNIRVEVLGGTRNVAFVGVPTRDAYFTMIVSNSGTPGLRVLDTLPSTPVKLPKR